MFPLNSTNVVTMGYNIFMHIKFRYIYHVNAQQITWSKNDLLYITVTLHDVSYSFHK